MSGNDDNYDNTSAIWVMACSDQDAIITYKGIEHRLDNISEDRAKELVKGHPELFSQVVSADWFAEWHKWVLNEANPATAIGPLGCLRCLLRSAWLSSTCSTPRVYFGVSSGRAAMILGPTPASLPVPAPSRPKKSRLVWSISTVSAKRKWNASTGNIKRK
jgi:hypothetical protein